MLVTHLFYTQHAWLHMLLQTILCGMLAPLKPAVVSLNRYVHF